MELALQNEWMIILFRTIGGKGLRSPGIHANLYLDAAYNWMPPELMKDELPTEKSDVYSFCTVMWELYTGRYLHLHVCARSDCCIKFGYCYLLLTILLNLLCITIAVFSFSSLVSLHVLAAVFKQVSFLGLVTMLNKFRGRFVIRKCWRWMILVSLPSL